MAAWTTYSDLVHGATVLTVDDTAAEVFTSRSADGRRLHLSQVQVTTKGPDRKGRYRFEVNAAARGAGLVILSPDDPEGAARVQTWLAAVEAARAVLPPPLA